MFIIFFIELKLVGLFVFLCEYLMFMEVLDKDLVECSVEDFYYFVWLVLVKDESNFDKFDCVFGMVFKGFDLMSEVVIIEILEEWLKKFVEKYFIEEEKV